jgi:cytoskeletal protein CcmA (bactofilin family)
MAHLLRGAARRVTRDEHGITMLTAMLVSLTVFVVAGTWTSVAYHQIDGSAQDRRREQALNAAEAGINLAMSHLTADPSYTGAATATLNDTTGQYEMTVSAVNPNDPNDTGRYIVSKGYSPSKTATRRVGRQLEQQVDLIATDGFRYALFSSPGSIATANNMTVTGDVYSQTNLVVANAAKIFGNVTALGSVTTNSNTTIGGDIDTPNNVTLNDSGTVVQGNTRAGGTVTMTGCVKGYVQAGGSISGSPPSACPKNWTPYSPPVPPKAQSLPTFTWDPANYPSSATWSTPSSFQSYWSANTGGFSGVHRVLCASPCSTTISLNKKWTMTGDVTIVADGPVSLSADVTNGTSAPVTLAIISYSSNTPALSMSNNITLPTDVHILFYAPNGTADFKNQKHFSGAVYARGMTIDQQFTLTFTPITIPGVNWSTASGSHFQIQSRAYKEVPLT